MNALRSLMAGILMLVALITVPVTALAAFSNAIDPDLVGLWHMDGDWGDSSGNGNNGIPYNGVMFSSTDKKVGTQAGIFNGTNSYVSVPNSTSLNIINSMTVELWAKSNINWDAHTNWTCLVNKRNDNYSGYDIYIDSNSPRVVFSIINTVGVGYYAPSPNLLPNTWYHIVGTYDGSNIKIYINGQLQNSVPASGTISTNTLNLEIGRWRDVYREYFNGLIDEVAIYKRALSATEIQEQYRTYAVNSPTVNPVTSPTATSTITLSGTKPANTAIVVNGSTLVPLDGTTTWQASYTLSAGMNTISVTALDSQNLNSLPVTLTVVLDTTPPQVTATTPTNNGILKTAPGAIIFTLADALSPLDFTATLNGATVKNASGFTIAGTWSTSGSGTTGSVTFTPSAALSDGSYTATIKPTDTLANGSTYSLTFTIDSTPPVAPGIDPVTAPINTTSKTITGTKSSDSASVAVSCAGATIGTIVYPTATTWSVNASGLKEGSNTITAYAVDTAGNPSATATATITVDTTPPTVGATPAGGIYNSTQSVALAANEPAVFYYTTDGSTPTVSATMYSQPISIPAGATLKYFGRDLAGNLSVIKTENYVIDATPPVLAISTLSDGAYTNNSVLNIAGTATDNTGVQGVTVNDTAVPVNADGSFSYAFVLQSGKNTITVTATDLADNKTSDVRTINLDQTAPALVISTPADNTKTGTALLTVSGSVDETSTVVAKLGDTVQPVVQTGNSFSSDLTLVPGYNTIEVTATDLANNTSTQKRTVLYDNQTPSLAITNPNQDIRTNLSSLTIEGTASDPLTAVNVSIAMDGQTFTPAVVNGAFAQAVTFTTEKSYAIVVTATNEVGTTATVQRNVIYDITPPALTIDPVASPTNQNNQTVTGTMEAGATVTVTCSTATVGAVTYPTATTWSATVSGLTAEANNIAVTAVDAAGNATNVTTQIVYDTTPPTGLMTNGGVTLTNATQVQLALSASDANGVSQMRFSNDGTNWTDAEAFASTKAWLLVSGDGVKQVYVQYKDTAGNWSVNPISVSITLDTTPPIVSAAPAGGIFKTAQNVTLTASEPATIYYTTDGTMPTTGSLIYSQAISISANTTLNYLARDLVGNVGAVKTENYKIDTQPPILTVSALSDGAYTNNSVLNIAGTATDNTGVQGVTVNDTAVPVNADGSFSYALLLKNGVNIITIAATDSAGNKATDTRTVTLDQTAPVLAVTTPADNSKTGKALLEVSGTVDKTSAVTVKVKDIVQSAVMNGGAFTATINLDPGYNTSEITATDLAGNQSSVKRTVVFDDQVPSLAVTVPNQDMRTNQSSLTIKGTVYDALTVVGVTISKGNEIFAPPVINGTFEQVVNFTEEKTYGIVVTATNEVGTSASVQRNVIYDITPPALSIDPVTTPTSLPSQSVSGTKEAGAAVTVTCATATVGEVSYPTATTWLADISGLREGENVITAASADAAGNAVRATATVVLTTVLPQITVTGLPQITITATPDVIWPPDHKMVPVTIAGGVEANGSDIKLVSISVSDEYGKYEYNNLTFGSTVMLEAWRNGNDTDGRKYTITVVVTDRGGITTAKTATVTVPHDRSK